MSPDWSKEPDAVPYANLENPQSLNLYGYVQNNPLSHKDEDGHFTLPRCGCPDYSGPQQDIEWFFGRLSLGFQLYYQQFFGKKTPVVPPVVTPAQTANPNPDDKQESGKKKTSRNQLQKQVEKGKAPKTVERVDPGIGPNEQDHIHFSDDSALNEDGTWKHGGRPLSNAETEWIQENGWNTPKQP
jgi:hypothetical protein